MQFGELFARPRPLILLTIGLVLLFFVDLAYSLYFQAFEISPYGKGGQYVEGHWAIFQWPIGNFALESLRWFGRTLQEYHDSIITAATVVIAWFTATLWRANHGLWKIANRQLEDMKRSIAASEKAAEAAERTVNKMEENAQRELRAYVSVKQLFQTAVLDPENRKLNGSHVAVEWQNTGRTPTRNLTQWESFALFDPDVPDDCNFPPPENFDYTKYTSVIGSNSTIFSGNIFIRLASLERVGQNRGKLYIWGRIDYNDVLANTPKRHTEFCVRALVVRDETSTSDVPLSFDVYHKQNSDS
jgi:hypothetical protein